MTIGLKKSSFPEVIEKLPIILSFDIRICLEFPDTVGVFGFGLNMTFRSGTIYLLVNLPAISSPLNLLENRHFLWYVILFPVII